MWSTLRQTLDKTLDIIHDRTNNEALSKNSGWAHKRQKNSKNLQIWTLHNCIEVGQVMQHLTLTNWIKKVSKWFDLER